MVVAVAMYWNDPRLIWDPGEFNNISRILRNYAKIWTPILGFSSQPIYPPLTHDYPVEVHHDGRVNFGFKNEIVVLTELSTSSYPFDTQTIVFFLRQLRGGIRLVNLVLESAEIQEVNMRGEWNLISSGCIRNVQYSSSAMDYYPYINCNVKMRRDPTYIMINFCIPSFTVAFLAVISQHCASSSTGPRTTKFQMSLMAMISTSVLSLQLTASLPHKSVITRMHWFYFGLVGSVVSSSCMSWFLLVADRRRSKSERMSGGVCSLEFWDGISFVSHCAFLCGLFAWFVSL